MIKSVLVPLVGEAGNDAILEMAQGGYSHSRTREFVLGSATRYMLEAGNSPVLIVH